MPCQALRYQGGNVTTFHCSLVTLRYAFLWFIHLIYIYIDCSSSRIPTPFPFLLICRLLVPKWLPVLIFLILWPRSAGGDDGTIPTSRSQTLIDRHWGPFRLRPTQRGWNVSRSISLLAWSRSTNTISFFFFCCIQSSHSSLFLSLFAQTPHVIFRQGRKKKRWARGVILPNLTHTAEARSRWRPAWQQSASN